MNDGQFLIIASGVDIYWNQDEFGFLYQPLQGDGVIQAKLLSLQPSAPYARLGVMMRQSLADGAPNVYMGQTAQFGTVWTFRETLDGESDVVWGSVPQLPCWVKIARQNDRFTGYESADGLAWVEVASQEITMGSTVLVGVACASLSSPLLTRGRVAEVIVS